MLLLIQAQPDKYIGYVPLIIVKVQKITDAPTKVKLNTAELVLAKLAKIGEH